MQLNPYLRLMLQASAHAEQSGAKSRPILAPLDSTVLSGEVPTDALRRFGISVLPWTTNEPKLMRRLIPNVDGLITDRPDLLQTVLSEMNTGLQHPQFEVSGHRGARGLRPENTLPAFEAALDWHSHSIEADCVITADGIPLIWHDEFLDPRSCRRADQRPYTMADRVYIHDIAFEDAQAAFICNKLRFGGSQANDWVLSPASVQFAAEERLPNPYAPISVEQLFRFTSYYSDYYSAGGKLDARKAAVAEQVRFNLEAKVFTRASAAAIAEVLCRTIHRNGMCARTRVLSFDFSVLLLIQERSPEIQICYLTEGDRGLSPDGVSEILRPG